MTGQAGFFDVDERLQRLIDLGDQPEAYAKAVDFEMFRSALEGALAYADGMKGGRPPYDAVMMFKILVIQAQNNLSDERTEFLINDRLSFMRFLGLSLGVRVPDAKTVWLFRERLIRAGAIATPAGYIAMAGQIVDASLVPAPKQRNTDAEKAEIKAGRVPQSWSDIPARLGQKDRDARWAVKFSKAKPRADGTIDIAIPIFGYQNHISTDRRHGLIRNWAVTGAAAYEGLMLRQGLLDKTNIPVRRCGPIPPAARGRTRRSWYGMALPARSIARSPSANRCPTPIRRANARKSALRSRIEHVWPGDSRLAVITLTHQLHRTSEHDLKRPITHADQWLGNTSRATSKWLLKSLSKGRSVLVWR